MFKFLKRKSKSRTMLDDLNEVLGRIIPKGYRQFAAQRGCAPTPKTTDEHIMEIYSKVGTAFREVSERRGEHIPALYLNNIVWYFIDISETFGDKFMEEHLQYEVEKYLREGLRPDYKRELRLFDLDSNDPDVILLLELQRLTREKISLN